MFLFHVRYSSMEKKHEFYKKCADILGIEIELVPIGKIYEKYDHITEKWYRPDSNKNRWNNRHPGNGRYPGFGVIRHYSENHIHLMFQSPQALNKFFSSEEEVYEFLTNLKKENIISD